MAKRLITLALLVLVSACSGTESGGSSAAISEGPAAIAQKIVAEHTGTNFKHVLILSTENVDFPDAGLDCPKPDMAYLQVITPGQKVLAQVGEQNYDVRVSGQQGFICEQQPQQPPKRELPVTR